MDSTLPDKVLALAAKESTTPVFAATESPAILDFALAVMRLVAEECAKFVETTPLVVAPTFTKDAEAVAFLSEILNHPNIKRQLAAAIRKAAEGAE